MKTLSLVLASLLIALPSLARASDPPQCTAAQALTVPCVGVLLPSEAAAEGLRCLEQDLPRLKLHSETMEEIYKAKINSLTLVLDSERRRGDRLSGLLDTAIEVRESPSFWEHPAFWFALGFVVATGTAVGITYAVNRQ